MDMTIQEVTGNTAGEYFFQSERAFASLHELQNEKESVPLSVCKEKFNRRDLLARRRDETWRAAPTRSGDTGFPARRYPGAHDLDLRFAVEKIAKPVLEKVEQVRHR